MTARTIPITENGAADNVTRLFDPAHPKVMFGPTLARATNADSAKAYIDGQDVRRAIGSVYVELRRSHLPDMLNVEAAIGLPPALALVALHVADQRIRHLWGLADSRMNVTAIDVFNADVLRETAQTLVQTIRARPPTPADFNPIQFELTFEQAVTQAILALTTAPITPRALAEG